MKKHDKNLNNRAFLALLAGTKKIEIRPHKGGARGCFSHINVGDTLIFTNTKTNEKLSCVVQQKKHYSSIRSLLEKEGTQYTLSSTNDLEQGITSIESIKGYKEYIAQFGVFSIHVSKVRLIEKAIDEINSE